MNSGVVISLFLPEGWEMFPALIMTTCVQSDHMIMGDIENTQCLMR